MKMGYGKKRAKMPAAGSGKTAPGRKRNPPGSKVGKRTGMKKAGKRTNRRSGGSKGGY